MVDLSPNGPADQTANVLELEFTFKTQTQSASPTLKSVQVAYRCEAGP
jgi:hypothetical protein